MKNGAEVRTLDELKANFDIESVLGYFTDGKLATWLADRYYGTEAAKVSELNSDSYDFKVKLCEVLGILYTENPNEETDLDYINKRNEKKAVLSQLTDEAELLNNIDSVALNQDDLLDCYDMGFSTIYLVGDTVFSIPVSVTNVTYIGRYGAKAAIRATGDIDFNEKNIVFKDVSFVGDIIPEIEKKVEQDNSISLSSSNCSLECDGTNFKEILELAKNGNAEAQYEIGKFIFENDDPISADYWFMKAINGGCLRAMYYCASFTKNSHYRKYIVSAAENGYVPAQYKLSRWYRLGEHGFNKSNSQSYEWLKKAAENGYLFAQRDLGDILSSHFSNPFGTSDKDEAIMWLTKAAEQGDAKACIDVSKIFYNTKKDKTKAIEWLKIAAENGASKAVKYLEEIEDGSGYI